MTMPFMDSLDSVSISSGKKLRDVSVEEALALVRRRGDLQPLLNIFQGCEDFEPGKQGDSRKVIDMLAKLLQAKGSTLLNPMKCERQFVCSTCKFVRPPNPKITFWVDLAAQGKPASVQALFDRGTKIACPKCQGVMEPKGLSDVLVLNFNNTEGEISVSEITEQIQGPDGQSWSLAGSVRHYGSHRSGHYTAYIKHDKTWYFCNDDSVQAVSEQKVFSEPSFLRMALFVKNKQEASGTVQQTPSPHGDVGKDLQAAVAAALQQDAPAMPVPYATGHVHVVSPSSIIDSAAQPLPVHATPPLNGLPLEPIVNPWAVVEGLQHEVRLLRQSIDVLTNQVSLVLTDTSASGQLLKFKKLKKTKMQLVLHFTQPIDLGWAPALVSSQMNWCVAHARPMLRVTSNSLSFSVSIRPQQGLQYKFVLQGPHQQEIWEHGDNRVLKLEDVDAEIIHHNWRKTE